MSKNLIRRVFTSLLLLSLLSICLFLNKYSWLLLLIVASIISFFEFNNLSKKIWKKKFSSIFLVNLFSIFYLIFFCYTGYIFYKSSLYEIIFVISICAFSDIGGYIFGKTIGGKKLTKISPNKTISGSIGSFIFSLLPLIFLLIIYELTNNDIFKIYQSQYENLILLCLFTCLISQLGDLLISYFKRKAKIKDTGSILPGHGGLLDRIDGIIFALPSVFIVDKILF
tara:strand:+ start:116 stop:793 length:678 start_codon:yes stop_codon:yes gene_type:complete